MHQQIQQTDALANHQTGILRNKSAVHKIGPVVRITLFALATGLLVAGVHFPKTVGLFLFITGFFNYLILIAFRLSNNVGQLARSAPKQAPFDPEYWPSFTIIVPLKREGEVVHGTLRAIASLDYPDVLKQVIVVVEETDTMTLSALRDADLPSNFERLLIPEQLPFTKGRALLHALRSARGEYVTVYDAESRPEPQQLRQAARVLAMPGGPWCLQASIRISNQSTNWITRNFASEYYEWYERHLRELSDQEMPFGLGGNSFFISRALLEEASAWDPYNVTEDADLAVRLIEKQVRLRLLDSVTTETCPERMTDWTNQRTRWNKGLFVTQLVHLPRSVAIRQFGFAGWLNFWLPMACSSLVPFFNTFVPVYLICGGFSFQWLFVLSGSLWLMFLINVVCSTLINKLTYKRLGIRASYATAFFDVLAYLVLHLGAGFKAYAEYFWSPLHWHKTAHKEAQTTKESVLNIP
ncbi:MAG: glycosyltransferase [Saprospiraceae bacterium]